MQEKVAAADKVQFRINNRTMKAYSKYKAFTREFESPLYAIADWDEFLLMMGGVFGGMGYLGTTIFFIVNASAFNGSWFWAALPTLIVLLPVGIADLPKRFSYRKNLLRVLLINRLARQLKRKVSRSYELKVVKSGRWGGRENFRDIASRILDDENNNTYKADFKGESRVTHDTGNCQLTYDCKTESFTLQTRTDYGDWSLATPVRNKIAAIEVKAELVKSVEVGAPEAKAEVAAERLPELTVNTAFLAGLPKPVKSRVEQIAELYLVLRGSQLSDEDCYIVERAGNDLQEAVTLFQTITRLRGDKATVVVVELLDKLSEELESVRERSLNTAMTTINSRRLYVKER